MITWLGAGNNVIGLQCVDSLGNINLDYLALALYSTNTIPGLRLSSANLPGSVAVVFDPIPGLTYSVDWNSNWPNSTVWQTTSNFTSSGGTVQLGPASSPLGFFRIKAQP